MPWKKINASIDRRSAQRIWAVFNYSIISLSCEMEPHAYWFIKWNIVLFQERRKRNNIPSDKSLLNLSNEVVIVL